MLIVKDPLAPIPPLFSRYLRDHRSDAEAILSAMETAPHVAVRGDLPDVSHLPIAEKVPWHSSGYYLEHRPAFYLDPIFHAGHYYVQDASSMVLAHIIKQLSLDQTVQTALDLCAAPGGKSTLVQSCLPKTAVLIANEIDKKRYHILEENIIKQGVANSILFNENIERLSHTLAPVDLIIIDAPCSGEGMMRKDDHARKQWSPALVKKCQSMQTDILHHGLELLNPHGYLIYSTCTFNAEENDHHYDTLMEKGYRALPISGLDAHGWVCHAEKYIYRAWPHKVKGEGLCFFVLQKTDGEPSKRNKKLKSKKQKNTDTNIQYSTSQPVSDYIKKITDQSIIRHKGVAERVQKGKNEIPHIHGGKVHAPEDLPNRTLSRQEALKYLAGHDLRMSESTNGWIAMYYDKYFLGYGKAVGSRISNHYPKHWRIRNLPRDLTDLDG